MTCRWPTWVMWRKWPKWPNVVMIIYLNVDLCFFYLLPFLRNSQSNPFYTHNSQSKRSPGSSLDCVFQSNLKNNTRNFGVLAEDISVKWHHLFFDRVVRHLSARGCYVTPNPIWPNILIRRTNLVTCPLGASPVRQLSARGASWYVTFDLDMWFYS